MTTSGWELLRLFLHITAATIWVGGQLVLAALVPALRCAGDHLDTQERLPDGAVEPPRAPRVFRRTAAPAVAES